MRPIAKRLRFFFPTFIPEIQAVFGMTTSCYGKSRFQSISGVKQVLAIKFLIGRKRIRVPNVIHQLPDVCIASNRGLPSAPGCLRLSRLAIVGAIKVLLTSDSLIPDRTSAPEIPFSMRSFGKRGGVLFSASNPAYREHLGTGRQTILNS